MTASRRIYIHCMHYLKVLSTTPRASSNAIITASQFSINFSRHFADADIILIYAFWLIYLY